MNTLPAKYILRKHNLETYLTKKIEPRVPFLSIFPTTNNETGEFATVLEAPTAKEDTDNEVMSEPMRITEGADINDINISPLNATLGETMAVGYQFTYTKKFLKRQDSDARITYAISQIIAGMAHKLNAIFLKGASDAAAAAYPNNLSDWDDIGDIDPRADAIKLRSAFSSGSAGADDLPFELDTCFISNAKHVTLQEYYMSMEWPFNAQEVNVDGTMFRNIKNGLSSLSGVDLVGLDSTTPPGIIEKYVDPDYSVIRQAELADPQRSIELPDSLINVNLVEPRKFEDPYIYQVIAEVGYNSVNPLGVIKGAL